MRRCIVLRDASSVEEEAARRILVAVAEAAASRGRCNLALAGGSTPVGIYARLALAPGVDWGSVHVYWGDERAVPAGSPENNASMARHALLDHVPIPADQIHPMPTAAADLDAAARAYEELLSLHLGRPPCMDLVLLGLGPDAHTASLFPGSPAVQERERYVVATPAPAIAPRLTVTPPLLNAARALLLVAHGIAKARALHGVLHAAHDPSRFPPHALRHETLTILVDRAAAGDVEA